MGCPFPPHRNMQEESQIKTRLWRVAIALYKNEGGETLSPSDRAFAARRAPLIAAIARVSREAAELDEDKFVTEPGSRAVLPRDPHTDPAEFARDYALLVKLRDRAIAVEAEIVSAERERDATRTR